MDSLYEGSLNYEINQFSDDEEDDNSSNRDWKQYFSPNEIEDALSRLSKGVDPD